MAARFKIGRQQWLQMLEKERGINEQQYTRDILWPTLALRKLAADQLQVTDQQVQEAYEAQFGEAVKARLIVVATREEADNCTANWSPTRTISPAWRCRNRRTSTARASAG